MQLRLLEVLGNRIRVAVPAGASSAVFDTHYPFWVRDDDALPVDAVIDCDLDGSGAPDLVAFQHRLDAVLVERLNSFAVAHAGAVEIDGLLVVTPGPSRSGKSSFVSAVVQSFGGRYLSDEYVMFDGYGRAHAYPRPLMRRGRDDRSTLDAAIVGCHDELPAPRMPDVLLFLAHQDGAPSVALDRIDAGAAILALLRNTPATWSDRPGLLPAFLAAAAGAAAYTGVRGEAASAWSAIRERLRADRVVSVWPI